MKTKIEKISKTSAQIVASNDDLLTEILLRLPVKSLIRFKLVSNHWHSLITNPQFRLLPKPNPAIGLFLPIFYFKENPWYEYVPFSINKTPTNPPFKELSFVEDHSDIIIAHSCNGLLLCYSLGSRENCRRYYVYNPTTKKFSTLPKLECSGSISTIIHGECLAFDPIRSPHYKVVCVLLAGSCSDDSRYQFEVYSSETGTWRKWGSPFTERVDFRNGVYWNGAIHWIGDYTRNSLYFNLDDDDHRQMPRIMPMPPVPPHGRGVRFKNYLGESCDHLHYVESFEPQVLKFNVYEMKRDHSKWFVKYEVNLLHIVSAYPGMVRANYYPMNWYYYVFSIFTIVRGEKDEDSFLVLQITGKAIRYNIVCKTFKTIYEFKGAAVEESLRFPNTNGFNTLSPSAASKSLMFGNWILLKI